MGDDSQLPDVGKDTTQFEHNVLNNALYVPSLAADLLSVYQMTHTGSPKRVLFEPDTIDISYISSRKMIAKGVANHASKAYEFSHFFPYSHQSSLLTHDNETIRLRHERFGHLNFKYLQQLHNEGMVEGFLLVKFSQGICKCCLVGKHLG